MGWVLLILFLVGGVLAYIYLVNLEAEIRAEIEAAEARPKQAPQPAAPQHKGASASLEESICESVRLSPELLQTDLYVQRPETDRKLIQKTVLDLVRSGKLARVRSGNTYKLTFMD